MSSPVHPVPYDRELELALSNLPIPAVITREMIPAMREGTAKISTESILSEFPVSHREVQIDGPSGKIILSIVEKQLAATASATRPAILYIHGGDRIMANRFSGIATIAEWVVDFDAVGVSVEYSLVPENNGRVALDECYEALKWVSESAEQLGIDPLRLMVAGQSAGGGLAAGVALLARDREGPRICAQLLMCPMLDDQSDSVSCRQYEQTGLWSRASNVMVWSCILGEGHSSDPSMYLAPARAANLVNLPPAYIDVGSAEIYRDEDVAYASKLWEHGVQAELHVWPGGFHAFDAMAPAAELSQKAIKCRTEWVGKMLRSC